MPCRTVPQTFSVSRDLATEIIEAQRIPEEKVRLVSPGFHASVWDKLLEYGESEAVMPSTGVMGIETILQDSRFKIYKKNTLSGSVGLDGRDIHGNWKGNWFTTTSARGNCLLRIKSAGTSISLSKESSKKVMVKPEAEKLCIMNWPCSG